MGAPLSKGSILTRAATYTFGDFTLKVNEGARATMTLSVPNGFNQRNERSQECVLTFDVEDASDVVALIQHALSAREAGDT